MNVQLVIHRTIVINCRLFREITNFRISTRYSSYAPCNVLCFVNHSLILLPTLPHAHPTLPHSHVFSHTHVFPPRLPFLSASVLSYRCSTPTAAAASSWQRCWVDELWACRWCLVYWLSRSQWIAGEQFVLTSATATEMPALITVLLLRSVCFSASTVIGTFPNFK